MIYAYSILVSNSTESGITARLADKIDIAEYYDIVRQKVTTLNAYSSRLFLLATTSYGYVVSIGTISMTPTELCKHHRGNITSSCFVSNYQYYVTASGSLSQNHDNTINVYKVCTIAEDIFIKKMHSFKNAHGK